MTESSGRVAIVTGAGRGLGRAYAHLLAAEGMKVVVNSVARDGGANDRSSAEEVVDEIRGFGGEAEPHLADLSSWPAAGELIDHALQSFGRLDVLVNNAGMLRDRTLANMTEEEWDSVVNVHLKGQAATVHWAAAYWRDRHRRGEASPAAVVNTTAGAGLFGNPGQANYAAAKAGVVALTLVAARELQRYDVRVNAVAPFARTRLTTAVPGLSDSVQPPEDPATFDPYDPANVAPLVAFLVDERCPFTGQVFNAQGGDVILYEGWTVHEAFYKKERWTVDELKAALSKLPPGPPAFAPPRLGGES